MPNPTERFCLSILNLKWNRFDILKKWESILISCLLIIHRQHSLVRLHSRVDQLLERYCQCLKLITCENCLNFRVHSWENHQKDSNDSNVQGCSLYDI